MDQTRKGEVGVGLGTCADCGEAALVKKSIDYTFPYGSGVSATKITTRLPVIQCQKCGSELLDDEAQVLQHEAVCRHLGVLTPREIVSIRKSLHLTRQEFARLTRIGEATVARWESGTLIQNAGYDGYLYLLMDAQNVQRLRRRSTGGDATGMPFPKPLFKVLQPTPGDEVKARGFRLTGEVA